MDHLTGESDLKVGDFKSFNVAVYCRVYEAKKKADQEWMAPLWDDLTRQVPVDKIYLEAHRDLLILEEETLEIKAHSFRVFNY